MPLPTRLCHTRDFSLQGEFAKTDSTQAKLPIDATGTATTLAPRVFPNLKLRFTSGLDDKACFWHS